MFKTPAPVIIPPEVHTAVVTATPAGMRQPWRAECECGWVSISYVRAHAAQIMADAHNTDPDSV